MQPEELADVDLVSRMARGDREALAQLYERHAARLFALSRAVLREPKEAEDLVHDVFLEAWRRAADYSSERGSVQTWLLLRTRSRALDRMKAAGRRSQVLHTEDLVAEVAGPGSERDQSRLREVVAQMPLPQQEVIFLGYFEGLSSSEIAERLAIPPGTVKSRMRAALCTLRAKFQEASHG